MHNFCTILIFQELSENLPITNKTSVGPWLEYIHTYINTLDKWLMTDEFTSRIQDKHCKIPFPLITQILLLLVN